MSRAAVKKVRGYKRFTVEELYEVIPDDVRRFVSVAQLRPILDDLVDSRDLRVSLGADDVLRYRFAKTRTAYMLVARVNALTPDPVSQRATEIPTVAMLIERARGTGSGEEGEVATPFSGLRAVAASYEELAAARDELVEVMRCLNLPTARSQPSNDEAREWAAEMLRTVRRALREHPSHAEPDTLCVTCRSRARHFGEFCKRCCPPDQRPHGKVT